MSAKKPPSKPAPDPIAFSLAAFREHASILRAQGACAVTASFGPDIVFTVNYPEDEEPRVVH